jgi:hypothetical protein
MITASFQDSSQSSFPFRSGLMGREVLSDPVEPFLSLAESATHALRHEGIEVGLHPISQRWVIAY